jgi:small subunit ribosomal protein S6
MDQKKSYEGMFLLDAAQPNPEAAHEPIKAVLDRAQADVLSMKTWDERRLAYEIAGRKRGLYVLSYFKMDPERVVEFEHDCQLNDDILRVLIRRKDAISDEELNAETPHERGPSDSDEAGDDEDRRPSRSREDNESDDSDGDSDDDSDKSSADNNERDSDSDGDDSDSDDTDEEHEEK